MKWVLFDEWMINNGSLLASDHVCYMLEQVSGQELNIMEAHREAIYLADYITQ